MTLPTGTAGEPAQPDNLPDDQMLYLLREAEDASTRARMTLASCRRTRAKAEEVRRELAGAVAKLETVRLALKGR